MTTTNASKFFDKFAVTFDTFYDGKRNKIMQWIDKVFRKDMFLRFKYTFDFLSDLENCTVIDIGCGSGIYLLEALNRNAAHVTGLDPANGMLQLSEAHLTNQEYKNKFTLIESLFPSENVGTYDYAIIMGVLDYIENPVQFLSEVKKIITKATCISFPSKHWFRTPIRNFRYKLRNCPVYFYNETQINTLAKTTGFSKVIIKKIPGAGMDYHVTLFP